VIALRDGQVVSDTPTTERKSARQELERLGKEVTA